MHVHVWTIIVNSNAGHCRVSSKNRPMDITGMFFASVYTQA